MTPLSSSKAAGMVSGVAALLWEGRHRTRSFEVTDALLATAQRIEGATEERQGTGLVQFDAAKKRLDGVIP